MSRTFRNRHYHWDSAKTGGSKIALDYTEYDYDRYEGCTYRMPTPREAYKTFRWRHLDHHANRVSPGKWYRRNRMVENRRINKEELFRWVQRPDEYEPLFEEEARSCRWDWC
jgi:hypothetical protein